MVLNRHFVWDVLIVIQGCTFNKYYHTTSISSAAVTTIHFSITIYVHELFGYNVYVTGNK